MNKFVLPFLGLILFLVPCTASESPEQSQKSAEKLQSEIEKSSPDTTSNYEGRNIENLVLKGGGVLGIAYAGAIKELENEGLLKKIKRVAGTSAGSITAALIALNYNADEITTIVSSTNFNSFEDHKNPLHIATKYGLYEGVFLLDWIEELIHKKTNNAKITFGEMEALGHKELRVFSSDLTDGVIREFSARKTPNAVVSESIRASMSIPLFFEAWKFPNAIPDDHFYVDGGLIYNYPITTFSPENTLGFYLINKSKYPQLATGEDHVVSDNQLQDDQLLKYIEKLFITMRESQQLDFMQDEDQKAISVLIDDFGISPLDFTLGDDDKKKLYEEGMSATKKYLSTPIEID